MLLLLCLSLLLFLFFFFLFLFLCLFLILCCCCRCCCYCCCCWVSCRRCHCGDCCPRRRHRFGNRCRVRCLWLLMPHLWLSTPMFATSRVRCSYLLPLLLLWGALSARAFDWMWIPLFIIYARKDTLYSHPCSQLGQMSFDHVFEQSSDTHFRTHFLMHHRQPSFTSMCILIILGYGPRGNGFFQ